MFHLKDSKLEVDGMKSGTWRQKWRDRQDCSAAPPAPLIVLITEHKAAAPPSLRLYSPPQMAFVKQVQPN